LMNLNYLYCYDNKFSDDYNKYLKNYCRKKNIHLNI
jgi:hypothetical protein